MYCDKCGAENRDEAEYCVSCGVKLSDLKTPLPDDVQPADRSAGVSEDDFTEGFKQAVSGRYEILRELGRGGMAIVFLAKDTRLERNVALKLLPREISRDKTFTERFMREARISAKLSHPNIIPIHDVDSVGDFTYYSMSYIDGISLAQIIKKGGAINPKILSRLGIQICFALQQAHDKGVIHRDIKPENILINKKRMPVVVDFGIARAKSDSRLSSTGMFIGTPQYMSPEQIKGGELDHRSDLYSLGGVLYEMAVGKPAFRAEDTAALMYKQVHEPPTPPHIVNPRISPTLSALIMKALAKNPDDRPQSAKELGRMLHEFTQTGDIAGLEPAVPKKSVDEEKDAAVTVQEIDEIVQNVKDDSKTVLMKDTGDKEKFVTPDKEAQTGTVAMKSPPKKKQQETKEKRTKKKGAPFLLSGIVVVGVLGMLAYGAFSLLNKSRTPVSPPLMQAPREESGDDVKAPQTSPSADVPPVIERNTPRKREIKRQETEQAEPPRPSIPLKTADKPASESLTEQGLSEEKPATSVSPISTSPTESRDVPELSVTDRPSTGAAEQPVNTVPAPETVERSTEQPAGSGRLASRDIPDTSLPPVREPEPPGADSVVTISWVKVPGGTFEMGDSIGDIRKELLCTPVHRVTVSPFELSRTEITVSQYAVFLRETGRAIPDEWDKQLVRPERPVIFVSWQDANAFARWAGARLPTEAEWEFAARGGVSGRKYPWGSEPPQGRANLGHPWNNGQGWDEYLVPPGQFQANSYGLADMAGNVWEWTADRFGQYRPGLSINPAGSDSGSLRVMRGGAWNSTENFVRNAVRGPSNPEVKGPHIGFRIARDTR